MIVIPVSLDLEFESLFLAPDSGWQLGGCPPLTGVSTQVFLFHQISRRGNPILKSNRRFFRLSSTDARLLFCNKLKRLMITYNVTDGMLGQDNLCAYICPPLCSR